MTNQEILKKAFEKAQKGGWTKDKSHLAYLVNAADKYSPEFPYWIKPKSQTWQSFRYETVIFSHAFARAFWGEEEIGLHDCADSQSCCVGGCPMWKYHLQQMVLEEDPIKYLEKFL